MKINKLYKTTDLDREEREREIETESERVSMSWFQKIVRCWYKKK